MAILAGAGIQSPSHAPRRSWQQIFGGRTLWHRTQRFSFSTTFIKHNKGSGFPLRRE